MNDSTATMTDAGSINSEEMVKGPLPGGLTIYVELGSLYEYAPLEQRDDPQFWGEQWERGDFADPDGGPYLCWVEDGAGRTIDPPIPEEARAAAYKLAQATRSARSLARRASIAAPGPRRAPRLAQEGATG